MRVGILSMQKVENFGSFLQAYCLKNNIEKLGHECSFLDIKPGRKLYETENEKINKLKLIDKHILKRIDRHFFVKKRRKKFHEEIFPELGIKSGITNWDKQYDVVVIGSDEVFNCLQDATWGFSKNLLGKDINARKVITYAASCGHTNYQGIVKANLEKEIKNYFEEIEIFSVRDKNTKEFVSKLANKKIIENLDPVFTYDFNHKLPTLNLKDKYILVYGYDNRIKDENEIKYIKEMAKNKGLKVVSVGFYQRWCDENINVNAFELIEYVKNAEYVITDTFHGTIFSIKYNKKFATIIRDSNRDKLYDLLSRFNLTNRQVMDIRKIQKVAEEEIEYDKINVFIKKEKERSIEYLRENLK